MITTWDKVKAVLGLDDSKQVQVETLIPIIEEDFLAIRNKAFDLDDSDAIVYPTGAESTAIDMIEYRLQKRPIGVSSESLGDHSIGYKQSGKYPNEVTSAIKKYASWA